MFKQVALLMHNKFGFNVLPVNAKVPVNLYVIKELLGHEDIKTTQIYSHLQQHNLSIAVQLL